MSRLVEELIASALDPNEKVSQLLRKAEVAAARLDVAEFRAWAEAELNGYSGTEWKDVPEYREVFGELRAWNERAQDWLAVLHKDDRTRSSVPQRLVHPIGLIDSIANAGDVVISYEGELREKVMAALSGPAPSRVGIIIAGAKLRVVVDAVRNLVLKWALDLETAGVHGEGSSFTPSEKMLAAKATPHVTNEIRNTFGNIETLVVQQGTIGSTQSVSVTGFEGIAELVKALKESGAEVELSDGDRKILERNIEVLESESRSKSPAIKAIRMALATVWTLAGGVISSYVAAKYKIDIDGLLQSLKP